MRAETEGTRPPGAVTELARPWGTVTATATGHGEAVVLLHPLAMSREFWAPAGRALANRFRVITVDARGHGESRWDGTPFSVADLANDVAAVIEELAPDGARVLGMSMGGCVALSLTERRPDRTSSSKAARRSRAVRWVSTRSEPGDVIGHRRGRERGGHPRRPTGPRAGRSFGTWPGRVPRGSRTSLLGARTGSP